MATHPDLNPLDARLLSVFDEIYKTRSVSRTAEALGLGQPAVSIALGKLREQFGLQQVVLVGDRGLLTQTQIDMIRTWVTEGAKRN